MLRSEMMQQATNGKTIDSMIKTVNQVFKLIQLQNAYQDTDEGEMEKHTQERMMLTSKSIGGETMDVKTSGTPMMLPNIGESGGTELTRAKSAPPRNLPTHVDKIRKLQGVLSRVKRNQKNMESLQSDVETELKKQLDSLSKVVIEVESSGSLHTSLSFWITNDLEDITKRLFDLMSKVLVRAENQKKKKPSPDYQDSTYGGNIGITCLPAIHENDQDLRTLAVFRDVQGKFKELSTGSKICLLSFAVFPENQEVNRTMLMYWWIGEGIMPDDAKPEVFVKEILQDFTCKKLIEAVENKRKVEPKSYKMTPFVHASVVLISKEIGLFDMYAERKKPAMKQSKLNKVCLVEGSSSQKEAKNKHIDGADRIETVFNVSERFPDFACKWFSSTNILKVLYLGRWERTEREIEVDNRRVMKVLSSLRRLRFLSLQGISTIKSLSSSACKLTQLIILDLRDCDYLEKLPEDIYKLKNLVYLDLTGCEALESIPVGLARLFHLEVLKGFVVSDDREIACKLNELKRLLKLRKLSIIVDREDFGCHELIAAIDGFDALEKLKVQWGSGFSQSKKQRDNDHGKNDQLELKIKQKEAPSNFDRARTLGSDDWNMKVMTKTSLPKQLRKLDLQRFPDKELPDWLCPHNLLFLERLHLGSSRRLKGFGDSQPEKRINCNVKVLRLTCLPKLKVEWKELSEIYFPQLNFLESYECPRVTFCPCDREGIWRRP